MTISRDEIDAQLAMWGEAYVYRHPAANYDMILDASRVTRHFRRNEEGEEAGSWALARGQLRDLQATMQQIKLRSPVGILPSAAEICSHSFEVVEKMLDNIETFLG